MLTQEQDKSSTDQYVTTLTKLMKAQTFRVRTEKATLLLQHDNARLHTSVKSMEDIANLGWTALPHPPQSPDLVLFDFHLG